MLKLGILYETVLRWVAAGPPGDRLGLEDDPDADRPRDRQVGEGGDARQRAGARQPRRRLRRLYRLSGVVWHATGWSVVLSARRDAGLRPEARRDPRGQTERARPQADADPRANFEAAGGSRPTSSPRSGRAAGHPHRLPRRASATCSSPRPSPAAPAPIPGQPSAGRVLQPQPLSDRSIAHSEERRPGGSRACRKPPGPRRAAGRADGSRPPGRRGLRVGSRVGPGCVLGRPAQAAVEREQGRQVEAHGDQA